MTTKLQVEGCVNTAVVIGTTADTDGHCIKGSMKARPSRALD